MDKVQLKKLQAVSKEALDAEAAAKKLVEGLRVKVDRQRDKVALLRQEIDAANRGEPDNFAKFEAGKITREQREQFLMNRKKLHDDLALEEPRVGALVQQLADAQRDHAAAGTQLNDALFGLWRFVADSLIEELRRDSRARMLQVAVALAKAGGNYEWPVTTGTLFHKVFGNAPSHAERVVVAAALDKEFLS